MGDEQFQAFIKDHSGELLILTLTLLVLIALIVLVPQLLRASQRRAELRHDERLKALERGVPLVPEDERARHAGRTAVVVPSVVMITAGTVTGFLIAYKAENLFAITLSVWVVAGVVSLAAVTGGVAMIGRLAQIERGEDADAESEQFTE